MYHNLTLSLSSSALISSQWTMKSRIHSASYFQCERMKISVCCSFSLTMWFSVCQCARFSAAAAIERDSLSARTLPVDMSQRLNSSNQNVFWQFSIFHISLSQQRRRQQLQRFRLSRMSEKIEERKKFPFFLRDHIYWDSSSQENRRFCFLLEHTT